MEAYKKRVIKEKAELDDKLSKLNTFLDSDNFDGLDDSEKDRLRRQSETMDEYSSILDERISAF